LLEVGLSNTGLDTHVQLTLNLRPLTTDPLGGPADGLIRPYQFAFGLLDLADIRLTGAHATNPTINDVTFNTTLTLSVAGLLTQNYSVAATWADISNLTAAPTLSGIDGLQTLIRDGVSAVNEGLTQLASFAKGLDGFDALNTPIPILPPKAPAT